MRKAIYDRLTVLMMSALYILAVWGISYGMYQKEMMPHVRLWHDWCMTACTFVAILMDIVAVFAALMLTVVGLVSPHITAMSCEDFRDRFKLMGLALFFGVLTPIMGFVLYPILFVVAVVLVGYLVTARNRVVYKPK